MSDSVAEHYIAKVEENQHFEGLLEQDNKELQAEIERLKELLNEETMFEKIWQATKHWDLDNGRPIEGTDIRGYAGMTGDDVRVIIKAIKAVTPQGGSDAK